MSRVYQKRANLNSFVDQTVGPVLQKAVKRATDDKAKGEAILSVKVLDPSMGSGHFLVEATEYIARFLVELNAQPISTTKEAELAYWKRRAAQSCIYGVDLNPLAVELAKLSLWLSTVAKDRPLSFLDHHLRTGNALIGARFADLTYARNGEDKAALKRLFKVYHGIADLSTYFVELGNTYLREKGRFGFIIPNKFVRANYGEALRTFLTGQVSLLRLVDFGDLAVFRDATTYPMIVLTTKQQTDDDEAIPVKHTLLKQLPADNLAQAITDGESIVPTSALTGTHWSLEGERTQAIQAILEKMKAISVPLGQLVNGKLYRGVLTGFNEAFVIDRHTHDKLIADDPKSAEIIKPFVVGEDVKRYRVAYQERYIILSKKANAKNF